ncbi:hypothetical protein PHAVU_007G116275 [Phaseolus vulgaris]
MASPYATYSEMRINRRVAGDAVVVDGKRKRESREKKGNDGGKKRKSLRKHSEAAFQMHDTCQPSHSFRSSSEG